MKEHILQFFEYEHLSAHLQKVSAPFCELARAMVDEERGLPRNAERTVALRKLLEAKDAAVRALAAKDAAARVRAEAAEIEEETPAKPYDGSAKPSRSPDVASKEDLGFWKFNRQTEPVAQVASDEEVAATSAACMSVGISPVCLSPAIVARIIARLRAAEKSRP